MENVDHITPDELYKYSKSELIELLTEFMQSRDKYFDSTINGVVMDEEFIKYAKAVFPNNTDKVFHKYTDHARACMHQLLTLRYYSAVTGAMRWENSQEAAIVYTLDSELRYV